MQRLEAVLFLAREPLSSRKLSQFASLADATEARTLIRRLNELYDTNGRAFRVEDVAGGYQLLTRSPFAAWLRRLEYVPNEVRLSGPAMETLAVIAYRQPASRAEIEAIRGVNCGEMVRQLMDRDLVRIQGRSEELGRPYLYATTRRFLQLFGLKSIDKLPHVAELHALNEKKSTVLTGDGTDNQNDENSENGSDPDRKHEENDVTATIVADWPTEEVLDDSKLQTPVDAPRNSFDDDDDDDGWDDDDDDDLDDDDDDDLDDDDVDDELDEDDEDEDFDDEWEEVDDDDDEDDDDDDDDMGWDDDDEDDDDEVEEEDDEEY
ncbi:MAG: SMC-Scp complex subunit ScpB [Planctomycetaceae bacterium]|nr:SMC-Scp complex subunit ScpB [Planctomycetaceae bacterium]MCB9938504.1 SMC-Scp complex subunit ScpB [Planctomycetaceae bacterium]